MKQPEFANQNPIQPQLSDKAFKHVYSWTELQNRTKQAEWLHKQIINMMERDEKLETIQELVDQFELEITGLTDYYQRIYKAKLGKIKLALNASDEE